MESKYRNLLKDTFVFALGSIGSKCIVFFLVPLYTHCLTAEEYGVADFVFTVAQLLVPIISVVIFDAVIRYGLEYKEAAENVLLVGIIVAFLGSILLLILMPLIGMYEPIKDWKWYVYFYTIFNIFLSIMLNYLKVKGKNFIYSIICIFQTAILAGLNILLLVFLEGKIVGYLFSNIAASVIAIVIAVIGGDILSDLKKAKFDFGLFKEMIKYSSPLIFNNLAWWCIQSSDKVMIQSMVGVAALGVYTVATRIPSLINVVVSVFQQSWGISSVVEMDSTNDTSFYGNVFQIYTCAVFGACIVLTSVIKPFMMVYVGKEFFEAWRYTPFLIGAAAYSAVSAYYGAMYSALKKSLNNMVSTILAAITNIVFNYVLIQKIGLWGAICATFIAYVVLAFYRMIDVNRSIKMNIKKGKYIINSMLLIIQAVLVSFDYHVYAVSATIIVLYLLINFKMIYEILKKFVVNRKI